jgi:hypothetical protein
MVSIASWNIRGLNLSLKQKEVQHVVCSNKLSICAILESHVAISNLARVCNNIFKRWEWTSNGSLCQKGARIILGWDPLVCDVPVLTQSDQCMHV